MAVLKRIVFAALVAWLRPWGVGVRLAVCAMALVNLPARAAPTAPNAEYQIKAVFLFNFAQFVSWPERAFEHPNSPLIIGVLGDDPFGPYLDEVVRGEKIGEREIVARRYRRIEDIGDCHILFISRSESNSVEKILARLKERCVLTVGDAESFSHQGGMINLVTQGGKIRLHINVEAAKAAGLEISSKLLRPATIVNEEKK